MFYEFKDIDKKILNELQNKEELNKFFWQVPINPLNKLVTRPYCYDQLLLISEEKVNEIELISKKIYDIINQLIADIIPLMESDEIIASLGLPLKTKLFSTVPLLNENISYLCRFDFMLSENGDLKFIEANASTPFLLEESFLINNKLIRSHKYNSMKDNVDILQEVFIDNRKEEELILGKNLKVAFLSCTKEKDEEEFRTVEFLKNNYDTANNTKTIQVPYADIVVNENGVYYNDERIEVLYLPAYPYEFLMEDKDGFLLIELAKDKKVILRNHPCTFYMQNKGIFALLWSLKDNYFEEEEREIIEKYIPFTTFNVDHFIMNNEPFVQKTILGREGNSVYLYDEEQNCLNSDNKCNYMDFPSVFQSLESTIKCSKGNSAVFGSFMSNGRFSGLTARIGEKVTNEKACFLPIGLLEEK